MTPVELLQLLASKSNPDDGNADAMPERELRFVLEFKRRPRLSYQRKKLEKLLGTDRFTLRPLFENAKGEMATFIVLRFPGVERTVPDSTLFAMGYIVQDHLDLVSCEPELGTQIFADPEPPKPGERIESVDALGGSCWVDKPEPIDKLWALKTTFVDKAWAKSPGKGKGILIAQPDTGVAAHPELEAGALRFDLAKNIIDGSNDPTDPLNPSVANPGHGSSTSSVVISREAGQISGSAPGAELIPIRCTDDVKIFNGAPVAAAVDHARQKKAHIVTMSLGGSFSRSLRKAIGKAIGEDIIVFSAAGNCVRFVVYPARYNEVIAVGGVNVDDKMWKGSSRGSDVDFAAPAELVWRARHDVDNGGTPIVSGGQGTSFATALSAGIAALWLSHHGRDKLIKEARRRKTSLQELFRTAAKATARKPVGWDKSKLGAGIINAERLIDMKPKDIPAIGSESTGPAVALSDVKMLVAEATGQWPTAPDFDWPRYEAEVASLVYNDARFGRFTGLPGSESVTGTERPSGDIQKAAIQSGDPALRALAMRDVTQAGAGSRAMASKHPAKDLNIIGRAPETGLESVAAVSTTDVKRNLDKAGIRKRLDDVEKRFSSLEAAGETSDLANSLRKDVLKDGEELLERVRDSDGSLDLTGNERVTMEALVKMTGRPVIRFENGTIDIHNPELETWQGDVALLLPEIEKMQKSVGRINSNGQHMGTGFVVGPGLVMTNRHVAETFAAPIPSRHNPQQWVITSNGASINFAEDGRAAEDAFFVKSVVFAGPDPIVGEPIDFGDLDMALLEVETSNVHGAKLPETLEMHSEPDSISGPARLFMMGYPARPRVLPTDESGKIRMEVVQRLRVMFGQAYNVKYLSTGIVDQKPGDLEGDARGWVFTHDATTLGGNSGSPIFKISDGPARLAGLHFAGDWLRANFGHSIGRIAASGAVPAKHLKAAGIS